MNPSYNQQSGPFNNPTMQQGSVPGRPASGIASQANPMPGAVPVTNVPGSTYDPQARQSTAAAGAGLQDAPKSNPNSTQNALQIAEIRDGIVIMNDGSYRSVIQTRAINFDLMSPEEREAVEFSYQGFLNSLYFPIQINIRSKKVDLTPYITKLDKIRTEHDNMLLAVLMEDYINYMVTIGQQVNIMDKQFFVVIPYYPTIDIQNPLTASKGLFTGVQALFSKKGQKQITINENDLNKAKDELRNRVQAVLGGLMQCGVQGLPLDTQELIELYYDSYNPDTATRQKMKNFSAVTADVVTKGIGQAPQPSLEREMQ